MKPENEIDGLVVVVVPAGAAGWKVRITNESEDSMTVAWDESSFVMSTNETSGRLIRGETRKGDTAKSQPPSPLPPRSTVVETVFAEKLTGNGIEEGESLAVGRSANATVLADIKREREMRTRLINGGRIYITVNGPAGKKAWSGRVESTDVEVLNPKNQTDDAEEPPRRAPKKQSVDGEEPMRK